MDSLPLLLPTIWRRAIESFRELGLADWALGAVLCALMILSLFRPPTFLRHRMRWATPALLAATIAASVAWSWRLAWLSDDAFISFRYARNLVEGNGLVFNLGERVEGYTNFLWTILMAGALVLHVHPGQAAIVLGLSSLAGCLLLTSRIAVTMGSRRSPPTVSIAAVVLGGSYLFASYGTSGLETMFGAFLVVLSLERALHRAPLAAGLAATAAIMTRPDHAIFYVALALAMAMERPRRRDLLRYLLPLFALYVPYFLARFAYYGDLLPNTFYAKSGAGSHYAQGLVYILACSLGAGLAGLLPLAFAGVFHFRRHLVVRFALLAVPVYLLYLAKIGGDFMFGRLLVPVVPLLAILAEAGARRLVAFRRPLWAAAAMIPAALAVLPTRIIRPADKPWFIADERTFYPVTSFAPLHVDSPFYDWADQLLQTFPPGPDGPRIATGCVGIVGYRTMTPMLDVFGLTDRHVAHLPLAARGRPGHEKLASPAYLLQREVDISDIDVYPSEYLPFVRLPSVRIPLRLLRYSPAVVEPLRRRSPGSIPDFALYLKQYHPPEDQPDSFACDLWFFREFYFSRQPPEARTAFVQQLVDQHSIEPLLAPFFDADEHDSPAGWEAVSRLGFDEIDRSGWVQVGSSFRVWPVDTAPPAQVVPDNQVGPFLDTFDANDGDRATGTLQSPSFDVVGDVMTLLVGGGRDLPRVAVLLVVDGKLVSAATGCNSEMLSRRVWDLREHRGRQARLVFLDDSSAGWGHLLADELTQWRRRP